MTFLRTNCHLFWFLYSDKAHNIIHVHVACWILFLLENSVYLDLYIIMPITVITKELDDDNGDVKKQQ